MNCEECQSLVSELIASGRRPKAGEEVADHLAECAACGTEARRLEDLWHDLSHADPAESISEFSSRRMVRRFDEALGRVVAAGEAPATGAQRLAGGTPRWTGVAAALAVGLALGFLLGDRAQSGSEVAALRSEMRAVSETVGVALMSHPSASERLRGIALANAAGDPAGHAAGDEALAALVELVRNDPSDNVRMAAIEALASLVSAEDVGALLAGTLASQTSPQVQAAALEVLERGPREELDRALESTNLHPEVKAWFAGRAPAST